MKRPIHFQLWCCHMKVFQLNVSFNVPGYTCRATKWDASLFIFYLKDTTKIHWTRNAEKLNFETLPFQWIREKNITLYLKLMKTVLII